ncbi:patatin-like phospholipase family protein [Virgibacillus xinjiangensis]|uniref:Patatin-like phospholipase family protein n=1 Tax=Virgibacillus xinjiangensis TaxID=393090 RepID=A0ABV7CRU7_9BACI
MKIDGVFSGGGVKAFAFLGALESIEENGLEFERVAGTSAGAMVASFLAAGYKHVEISEMLQEMELKSFLDPPRLSRIIPASKWLLLYFQLGLYKGDKLEKWLKEQLAAKNIHTFYDLKPGYLKVIISDLSLGKLVVLPDDLERLYDIDPNEFSVAAAVRMSAGFPYFFMPKKLAGRTGQKSIIVDGGLLSNFPLWVFSQDGSRNRRPVLGVRLTKSMEKFGKPRDINNAFDMFHALFLTMKEAHDARYISKSQKSNIIFIPVGDVDATDFHLSEGTKQALIQTGRDYANTFLQYWPK